MKELKLQQCRLDDRYNILECLGRGSYAEIFLAQDTTVIQNSPNKLVVVKALNVSLQGDIDTELERTLVENFQNEAVALDRVRHRNVINRLGHGTAIDLRGTIFHYIILEYLPGGDIFKLCKNQPMPLKQTLFYLEQVCKGLAYAHKQGVIHRDIKPQNLLLTSDRKTVKIADFGVAKIGAHEGNITRVGTNIYAAPEHNPQLQTAQLASGETNFSKPKLSPAADIYSLAKTVYVMLTGDSPRRFEGHSIKDFPSNASNAPWANDVLEVLQKATRTNSLERYQTVREFWEEFEQAATNQSEIVSETDDTESISLQIAQPERILEESGHNSPPRPRFDSTRNLQKKKAYLDEAERPRIVVQFNESKPLDQTPFNTQTQNARSIINQMPDVSVEQQRREQKPPSQLAGTFKRFIVGVCLLIAFTTMLYATYYLIRHRTANNNTVVTNNSLIGREGTTKTNLNLRPDASARNKPVGLVEKDSKVKILAVTGDWYQIQVIDRPRPKNPSWSDQGWIHKDFVELN